MITKRASRALRRKISDIRYERMLQDIRPRMDPGGPRGTTLSPARPAHTPKRRLFG